MIQLFLPSHFLLGFAACGTWLIKDDNVNNCYCSRFKSPVLRTVCLPIKSVKFEDLPLQNFLIIVFFNRAARISSR